MKRILLFLLAFSLLIPVQAQNTPDEDQLGAWYMYYFTKRFDKSQFGIQGDYQYRSWNMGSDLEQLLLRTGVTYQPKNTTITFTTGYAYITSGKFGEPTDRTDENRIYQEALLPQKVGGRFLLTHRFRFEQRWIENQDFRTRFRYNLFINVPFNGKELKKGIVYLALYNEIFINGQRDIGNGKTVEIFDRNRTYLGLGYGLRNNLRVQGGWMLQATDKWTKAQLQFGVHHNW